jgi:hypothetical protein
MKSVDTKSSRDGDLDELHTFAKLVGLVRFFHPSDEAARTPWELFVLDGVNLLLEEPGFQLGTLQNMFEPIAPTVQITEGRSPSPLALPDMGDRTVAWGHAGLGLYSGQWNGLNSFRVGRPALQTDWVASRLWLGHKIAIPEPLSTRWRLTIEISGDPTAQIQAQVWEWGEGPARISRQSQTSRAVSRIHRSRLVMEHDTDGRVSHLNLTLVPEALQEVTLHKASIAFLNTEGVWSDEQFLPLSIGDNPKTEWKGRRSNMACSTEEAGLVCTRKNEKPKDGAPFEVPTKLGDIWQGEIGPGMYATIPLALPADEGSTFPRGHDVDTESRWLAELATRQGDDRSDPALRIASVIHAWTVMRYFHPHPESLRGTWDAMLNDALTAAREGSLPLKEVLGRMLAHLPDGHIELSDTQSMWRRFPFRLEEVDGRVFVIGSAMPRLRFGDELIAIEGEPIRVRLDRLYASKSGTDQWRRSRILDELRTATGKLLTLTIERDGVEQTLTLNIDDENGELDSKSSLYKMEGEHYFLDNTKNFDFTKEVAQTLSESEGFVNDLRGYANFDFLDHIVQPGTALRSTWASNSIRFRPDVIERWSRGGFVPESKEPFLDLPMVWLSNSRAISYSESVLGWVHHLDPDAYFIGTSPTAGANGGNHRFPLLGGFTMGWTSQRATFIDGTDYFGNGIGMDELVLWTVSAVEKGWDPLLHAAKSWLNRERAADPFLGMWIGDDGTELLVTRESIYHLDSTRWLGRWPVLKWSETGPTLCDRGLPNSETLVQEGGVLHLKLLSESVVLTRQPTGPTAGRQQMNLISRLQARVLPEPPPVLSTDEVAVITSELSRRVKAEQDVRIAKGGDMDRIDTDNLHWLRETIDSVGWIDSERFGLPATKAAWLLVQHSGDVGLLMAVAARLRNVTGLSEEWALTIDRLQTKLSEPQRFGHQARVMPDGGLAILPVTNPAEVKRERENLRLIPWSTYLGGFESGDSLPLLNCTDNPSERVSVTPTQ